VRASKAKGKVVGSILILTNDLSTASAKTSAFLASACERLGARAIVRDISEIRFVLSSGGEKRSIDASIANFEKLLTTFDVTAVLSLDMHWLIAPGLFEDKQAIKKIYSLWFDDLYSFCTTYNPGFSGETFQKIIRNPKVRHCFYGKNQCEEAKILGILNQALSFLAAPKEFTEYNFPQEIHDRAVFIGNPGLPMAPDPEVVCIMARKGELNEIREQARNQVLSELSRDPKTLNWVKGEPDVFKLLERATGIRLVSPGQGALKCLLEAGKEFPAALEYLDKGGHILEAALLVKFVNRYDRPAFVHRLYSCDLADVYSAPDLWAPYGIKARPFVSYPKLGESYQRYGLHLNAAHCAREAPGNEKLFEIAACGRVSINFDTPDLRTCFTDDEAVFVSSLGGLESVARDLLKNKKCVEEMGLKARERVLHDHLWEHRLEALFSGKV
jgi:hypothetical protein